MVMEMEDLRQKLNQMIETHERGSEEVLRVSRELDALIVSYLNKCLHRKTKHDIKDDTLYKNIHYIKVHI